MDNKELIKICYEAIDGYAKKVKDELDLILRRADKEKWDAMTLYHYVGKCLRANGITESKKYKFSLDNISQKY